jgi:hypothetical protein
LALSACHSHSSNASSPSAQSPTDVPGWKLAGTGSSSGAVDPLSAESLRKAAACLHVPLSIIDVSAIPHSEASFEQGRARSLLACAYVYPSATFAKSAYTAYIAPAAPSCIAAENAFSLVQRHHVVVTGLDTRLLNKIVRRLAARGITSAA